MALAPRVQAIPQTERRSAQARHDRRLALAMVIPAAVLLGGLSLYPFLYAVYDSFFSINTISNANSGFVGLGNYLTALANPDFGAALWRSAQWSVSNILLQTVLGLALSLLLNQELPGRSFARGVVLFPYVLPAIVAALVWRYMFNDANGIITYLLQQVHLINQAPLWLSSPRLAFWIIIVINVWKYVPFMVIVFLARLQTLPVELREAARVDGATAWHEFWRITFPWLKPVIIIAMLLRTIWVFNEFDMIYLLGYGGPLGSTTTLPVLIRSVAFDTLDYGQAAAVAVMMAIILMGIAVLYFRVYRSSELQLQ